MNTVQLTLRRHAVPAAAIGAATCAALLVGIALALDEPRIVVGVVAIVLVAIVSQLSEAATIRLLIVVLAVQGAMAYVTGYFPRGTLFADDAVALVLIVGWLARSVGSGHSIRTIGAVGGWLAIFLAYTAASIVQHRDTPLASQLLAVWQIAYLWPVGFIVASTMTSAVEVRRMLTFVWQLAWVQVAVVTLQWPLLFAAGEFTAIPPVDKFAGTLGKGHAHMLGIWISMMALLTVAFWIHGVLSRRQAAFSFVAFVFVLVSGSTRQMYVVLPAAIAVIVALSPLRVRSRAVLMVAIPILLLGFFRVYSVATQMSFSVENLVVKAQGTTRIAFYPYSWQVVQERGTVWFGEGPGSYTSTAGLRFDAPLAKKAALAFSHDVNLVSSTQWPVLFVELGAVGVAIVLLIFGALVWRMLMIARRSQWPLVRGLALGGVGAVLALLASALASRTLEYQLPSLHVWLICGLAAALYGIERNSPAPAGRVGS